MADAVDHASGEQRNPHHLHRPDGHTGEAEQNHVGQCHQHNAEHGEAAVDVALDPVIRAAGAVLVQGFLVQRFGLVELRAFAQYFADAKYLRAVRVFLAIAVGVMLAMNGGPGAGVHARGQPQPETEEVFQHRVQFQRAVGGIAVQIDGDADDGHMGQGQGDQHQAPGAQGQQALGQKHQDGVHNNPACGGSSPLESECGRFVP